MDGSYSVIQLRLCRLKKGLEHDNEHDFRNGPIEGYVALPIDDEGRGRFGTVYSPFGGCY
jgi:hypothetical protein